MTTRDDDLTPELVAIFRTTAVKRLERVGAAVIGLEQQPDATGLFNDALREFHTLKSEAKVLRYEAMAAVAHRAEELMLAARETRRNADPALYGLVLTAIDVLHSELARPSLPISPAVVAFSARADAFLAGARGLPVPLTSVVHGAPSGAMPADVRVDDGAAVDPTKIGRLLELASELRLGSASHRRIGDDLARAMVSLEAAGAELERALNALSSSSSGEHDAHTAIRAAVASHEALRERLRAAAGTSRDAAFDDALRLRRIETAIHELDMLPLALLLARFPRAVRDLAADQGKKVTLRVVGADVELDKHVLDKLGEPILHLLRNAVDHGIEAPERRRASGKPEAGSIVVFGSLVGSRVEIVVEDDGAGIDAARVREAAIARGLVAPDEAEAMSDREIVDLVFAPGFSTRKEATEISGRGMGLDIVRRRVEEWAGSVAVETSLGAGTRFRLVVPVSITLARVLVFRVGSGLFAVASTAVDAVTRVAPSSIEEFAQGRVFRFDGRPVPLVCLGAVLGVASNASSAHEAKPLLVVEHAGRTLGLEVDGFAGEQEALVREPGRFLEEHPLMRGTALLDDGSFAVLLDVAAIVAAASEPRARAAPGPEAPTARSAADLQRKLILVVDDSELMRARLVRLIRDLGHEVAEAVDGRDALSQMGRVVPDLVVTDLEMPLLDGFELLSRVRSSDPLRLVPILVISARGSDADIKRACELGADAYLVKDRFREGELVDVIDRFVSRQRP